MRISLIIGAIAIAVLIIAAVKYVPDWLGDSDDPPDLVEVTLPGTLDMAPQQQPPEPASVDPQPEQPEIVLPPLAESDDFVRAELEPLALPDGWTQRDDLVRRLAAVLDNAREGQYPQRQLTFMAPEGPFRVEQRDDRLYIDSASYRRYDPYLDLLENVEPATLAELLGTLEPLLAQALGELGNETPAKGQIKDQIKGAIDRLLEVPILRGDVEVLQPKVFYEYADPALEALPPLQKLALRMGPDNVERIKRYLTDLRAAL